MADTRRARILPYPEYLRGERGKGKWKVEDCGWQDGRVNIGEKVLYVPTGGDAKSRFTRIHELVHAQWSDEKLPTYNSPLEYACYQVVENIWVNDFIINRFGGFEESLPLPAINPYTSEVDKLLTLVEFERLGSRFKAWSNREAKKEGLEDKLKECRKICKYVTRSSSRSRRYSKAQELFKLLEQPPKEVDTTAVVDYVAPKRELGDEGARWLEVEIVRKLGVIGGSSKNVFSTKKSVSDKGVVPAYVHRYISDGMIFKRNLSSKDATVLLDMSGSMSYDRDNMNEFVKERPNVLVAGYCGDPNKAKGYLNILVESGKVANDLEPQAVENLCDLPALKWLAKQKKPRYWVSDGLVTKYFQGSNHTKEASDECFGFIKTHDIKRVDSVKKLNLLLRRGR